MRRPHSVAWAAVLVMVSASAMVVGLRNVVSGDEVDQVAELKKLVNEHSEELRKLRQARSVPVGTIIPYVGASLPDGYLLADGRLLEKLDNRFVNLCTVLGDAFKSADDAAGTCRLPDLQGRMLLGEGQGSGLSNRKLGEKVGEESFKITAAQMPRHAHPLDRKFVGDLAASGPGLKNYEVAVRADDRPGDQRLWATHETGTGEPVRAMPPAVVVRYIIKY
jgi:microcystin-dependent protein